MQNSSFVFHIIWNKNISLKKKEKKEREVILSVQSSFQSVFVSQTAWNSLSASFLCLIFLQRTVCWDISLSLFIKYVAMKQ